MQILRPIGVGRIPAKQWPELAPASPRVFVDNRESVVLSMRVISIYGEPVNCALVALPWVRCQCDGTDHAIKMVVAVEPCGVDRQGAQMYWDIGVVRFCSVDAAQEDGDGDDGEGTPDDDDGWGVV